jgi:hypothetical protein
MVHAVPDDSRAFRRELYAGLLGLVLGFVAVHASVAYLLARYVVPEDGGWRAFWLGVRALPITLAASLGCALAPMFVMQRWHYRRGVYRCARCGRALRGTAAWCACLPAEFRVPRRPRRPMRHYRRRVVPVSLAYLAVLPLAVAAAARAPGRGDMPYAVYALGFHVGLCVLAGVVVNLVCAVLEIVKRGRRFRLRAAVFLRVFSLWPLACVIAAMVLKAFGHG